MATQMTAQQSWWLLALSGIVSILFGLIALFWPGITLFVLVLFFGIYVFVTGIVELISMIRAMGMHQVWWTHLVLGLLGAGVGIIVLAWPGISTLALLWVIAIWAIAAGIIEIVAAFGTGRFLYFVTGLIAIFFGMILLANPVGGALALVTVIGIFAIIRGILQIIGAIRAPVASAQT